MAAGNLERPDRLAGWRRAWLLTAILWLASSDVITVGAIVAGQMRSPSEYLSVPFTVGTAALLSTIVFAALRLLERRRAVIALPVVIAAVVAAAMLQTAADFAMHALFVRIFPGHVMPDTSLASLMIVGAVYFALYCCNAALLWLSFVTEVANARQLALTSAKLDLAVADARRTHAELRMLRLQLDPHFMVNSLSAISTLSMTGDSRAAGDMADRLAEFLRCTLQHSDRPEMPLGEEIALARAYLDVEAVRFRHKLDATVDCPADLRTALIPNFILQPLVENAMKHGFGTSIGTMALAISARVEGDALVLAVEDRADRKRSGLSIQGLGIGLANTRERLEALYGARAALTTTTLDNGFRSEIRLPLRFAHPARAEDARPAPQPSLRPA